MNLNQRLLYGRGLFIFRMLLLIIAYLHCDYFGSGIANPTYFFEALCGNYINTNDRYCNATPGYCCAYNTYRDEPYDDSTMPSNPAILMGVWQGKYYYCNNYIYVPFITQAQTPAMTFAPTPTATKIICSCKSKKLEVRVVFSLVSTLQ